MRTSVTPSVPKNSVRTRTSILSWPGALQRAAGGAILAAGVTHALIAAVHALG